MKKVVNDKKPGSMPGEDYEKFFSLNLFLWRHLPVSSVLLLSVLGGLPGEWLAFLRGRDYTWRHRVDRY